MCCYYMHYFETLTAQWCHADGDVCAHAYQTPAVLSGSHSGGFVPDPHCSVFESGDIEILATHVSHHNFVCLCFVSFKASAPQDCY